MANTYYVQCLQVLLNVLFFFTTLIYIYKQHLNKVATANNVSLLITDMALFINRAM